jgi:hypothetical protein
MEDKIPVCLRCAFSLKSSIIFKLLSSRDHYQTCTKYIIKSMNFKIAKKNVFILISVFFLHWSILLLGLFFFIGGVSVCYSRVEK